jgi:hypothetical protein
MESCLLVSPIGNNNIRHNYEKIIWKTCEISVVIDLSILVMKRCLVLKQAISLGTVVSVSVCVCVCVGNSCVINQWHLECDCMQWGVFVPVFHTNVMQAAASCTIYVDYVWNVMTLAQKPDFVFRRDWRVHLNRRGRQFRRLPAAEVRASAVVMLDTPCSEAVWRVLPSHPICHFVILS